MPSRPVVKRVEQKNGLDANAGTASKIAASTHTHTHTWLLCAPAAGGGPDGGEDGGDQPQRARQHAVQLALFPL
eukprot:1161308-Pelagomonas_calceolata.AAC.2